MSGLLIAAEKAGIFIFMTFSLRFANNKDEMKIIVLNLKMFVCNVILFSQRNIYFCLYLMESNAALVKNSKPQFLMYAELEFAKFSR